MQRNDCTQTNLARNFLALQIRFVPNRRFRTAAPTHGILGTQIWGPKSGGRGISRGAARGVPRGAKIRAGGRNFHLTLPEFRRGGLLINVLFGWLSWRGRPSKKIGKAENRSLLCIFVHFRAFSRISVPPPLKPVAGGFPDLKIPTLFSTDFRAKKHEFLRQKSH
jgi:hypothetical protein